ncbi:MAG: hypothetical protein RBU37_10305 [Myxococcota bacterium]|jgi:hypothetical protein|nr:hypothetical protein [Myxococcota bacterium]
MLDEGRTAWLRLVLLACAVLLLLALVLWLERASMRVDTRFHFELGAQPRVEAQPRCASLGELEQAEPELEGCAEAAYAATAGRCVLPAWVWQQPGRSAGDAMKMYCLSVLLEQDASP